MTWGAVRKNSLRVISGEVRKVPYANRIRQFAACCGTHLFFADSEDAEWIDVTIASLDDPSPYSPKVSIWTEDRLPWVPLNEGRPAYERGRTGAGDPAGG